MLGHLAVAISDRASRTTRYTSAFAQPFSNVNMRLSWFYAPRKVMLSLVDNLRYGNAQDSTRANSGYSSCEVWPQSQPQRWSVCCSSFKQLLLRIVNGASIRYLKLLALLSSMVAIPHVGAMDVDGGVSKIQISSRILLNIGRGLWEQTLHSTQRLLTSVSPSLSFHFDPKHKMNIV